MNLGDLHLVTGHDRAFLGQPVLIFTTSTPEGAEGKAALERRDVEDLRAACDRFLAGEAIR